ncbi:sigma 54-interacting transcriptional regulator [Achromobacter sp. AGC39]
MDAQSVANVARDMASASRPDALAQVFVAACAAAPAVSAACLYARNATGDTLVPLASAGCPGADLHDISMDALDDPLVYAMTSGKPCLVERMSALVGVGAGFERLRERLGAGHGLLAVPLHDARRQSLAVLILAGPSLTLSTWRDHPVWRALQATHEALFMRLHAQAHAADDARYQRALRQTPAADAGKQRAARLLAAEFIGISAAAKAAREAMLRFADSALAVLLTGETGTGKDHAAWLIHQASSRNGKIVPVNCAAIPQDLIEAELFGNVRGAYTGAVQARTGLVAEADGGTLFLDEIGDMPMALQGTLLRLLNEKKFRPLGATREHGSDFRLICATHRPLPQLIRDGRFREDLYFRIRQLTLALPPLRERPEDIPALAHHTVLQHNRERQTRVTGIAPDALAVLAAHALPGNVRQLRSLILVASERTAPGHAIRADTLELSQGDVPPLPGHTAGTDLLHGLLHTDNLPQALDAFQSLVIRARLRQVNGSRSRAAQSLGIPKRTLARRCQAWNLDREDHTS